MATVPRFLLPRLSWTAGASISRPISQFAYRAICEQQRPLRRSLHSNSKFQNALRPSVSQAVSKATTGDRKPFTSTSRQGRDHHFDTLKFVQRLKDEGFTEDQAVAMMKVLGDVVEER